MGRGMGGGRGGGWEKERRDERRKRESNITPTSQPTWDCRRLSRLRETMVDGWVGPQCQGLTASTSGHFPRWESIPWPSTGPS